MLPPCPACPRLTRPILEPLPEERQRVVFVGEGPARDEHKHGIPFCGKTGEELNGQYLPLGGFSRDRVYVTNTCKCPQLPSYGNPPDKLALACSQHWFPFELGRLQPEILVVMGATALHTLFPNGPRDLNMEHGRPFWGEFKAYGSVVWDGWVFATYHPSAGLHDGDSIGLLRSDFKALRKWLEAGGDFGWDDEWPKDKADLRVLYTANELVGVLDEYESWDASLALDTETLPWGIQGSSRYNPTPYCLSFSYAGDHGYVVKADNETLIGILIDWIQSIVLPDDTRINLILHNKLFDQAPLRTMGIDVDYYPHRDTMIRAYNLGFIAREQGLKSLSYRLLNHLMSEFADVVEPASRPRVGDWIVSGADAIEEYMESEWPAPYQEGDADLTVKKPKPLTAKKAATLTRKWRVDQPGFRQADLAQRQVQKWIKKFSLESQWMPWGVLAKSSYRDLLVGLTGARIPPASVSCLTDAALADYAGDDSRMTLLLDRELDRVQEEIEGRVP